MEKDRKSRRHSEQKSEQPVTMYGNIGAKPSFFTTRSGVLIGHFALRPRGPAGAELRRVLVFRDRAEQLREAVTSGELAAGDLAEVRGYLHTRSVRGHDGRTRLREELFAWAVRTRAS